MYTMCVYELCFQDIIEFVHRVRDIHVYEDILEFVTKLHVMHFVALVVCAMYDDVT